MAGIQSRQEFIPVRTPTANDKLSEGMLTWSLVLPPVSNILQEVAATKRDHHPVRYSKTTEPFMMVGGSRLLPQDFQYTEVNPTPPAGSPDTSGQTGQPTTTPGTTGTAPLPVAYGDIPIAYAVYVFKPTVAQSVASVTQIGSIVISLSYYLPDWTFAIWIPSIQRYIEYVPSAPSEVPKAWVTVNAATNIEAAGGASVEFIFGQRQAQIEDQTAPYGSIHVNNYRVTEHLSITTLGGTGANGNGGSMVYPGAGIPVSTGEGWDTSLDVNNSFLKLTGGQMNGSILMGTTGSINVPNGWEMNLYGYSRVTFNSYIGQLLNVGGTAGNQIMANVPLMLAANPTANLQAATKQYVDTAAAALSDRIDVLESRMNGVLVLPNGVDLNTVRDSNLLWMSWGQVNGPTSGALLGQTIYDPNYSLQLAWELDNPGGTALHYRLYVMGTWYPWLNLNPA